jgi:signal transduction histidine kinase/CheY-like chemotaxis protein
VNQNNRKNNNKISPLCSLSLVVLFLFLLITPVFADGFAKHQVSVAYVYNFAKNVEWPLQGKSLFRIAVYGDADPALVDAFDSLKKRTRIQDLPIDVFYIRTLSAADEYDLVYILQPNKNALNDFYVVADSKPVLLVTDDYPDPSLVMINLQAKDNRIKFEVNKSNIINQGLKPLPELILNGGNEIDVAALYREGQSSLIKLQKQLASREKRLSSLEQKILQQEVLNEELQKKMQLLNLDIKKSSDQIIQQTQLLQQQDKQIERANLEKTGLLTEINNRTQQLESQQNMLTQVMTKIEQGEGRVKELDQVIKNQESRLVEQDHAITNLDQTVTSQKRSLLYSWALVFLGLLLIITIWFAYLTKKRDNRRLANHAQDLQFAKDRLLIAKRKADEASQAKSDFLSLMSHELRTPLQAIIGYTEVVLEELKFNDESRHLNDLTRVINNSERLLKLINSVLDLAKMEAGRMSLDLTQVKLSELVEDALGSIKPLADKKSLVLYTSVNDGESLPIADPEKLLLIMINLLGNAVKFTASGSVSLQATHENGAIDISVTDTGIGISANQIQLIFNAFHQLDHSRARKFEGSGLGLAITKQLVDLMGGKINVQSEPGQGTEFSVHIPLPIIPADKNNDEKYGGKTVDSYHEEESIIASDNVVMIDDDPAFLDIMARTLRADGYGVHTALDAVTGYQLLKKIKPKVITLDLLLPDQHGWTLFEKIKSDQELKEIPVIIISMVDEEKYSHTNKIDDYLTKPVRIETLKHAVQRLVPKSL